jgi:hypothetical protein
MYEVEVVHVTISTNCIVVEKGVFNYKSDRKKRVVKEKRVVNVKRVVKEERDEGEQGSENRETSNIREDNIVPPNEVGLEECVVKDVAQILP